MVLFVKNMVCNRCIHVVKQVLQKLHLEPLTIRLGEIEFDKPVSENQLSDLDARLREFGFEILDNHKQKQIENIKNLLIKKVQSGNIEEHFSIIDFLTTSIHKEYSTISRLFSVVEGITIEHFFILQKIEKVKELLVYAEQNLNEISWKLGYSSTAHLSNQFKKITGLTPGHFKKIGARHRKSLDKVISK